MTATEGIIGLIASVCAIITALIFVARWIGKKFDNWANAVIENSNALRGLTERVTRLEGKIEGMQGQ